MEDDVWESLKQFCRENKDQFETIPWGSSMRGEGNFMYGLRGENHPASAWLKNEATEDYFKRRNDGVKRSWMNAKERRKSHSETMKEKWASGKIDASIARKNGNHGLKGKEVHNTLEIEYKGETYYGWRELQEGTGVTKHLYNKYYLNGIDPETRIGANGPAKGTS
jgi:hypothetical protein